MTSANPRPLLRTRPDLRPPAVPVPGIEKRRIAVRKTLVAELVRVMGGEQILGTVPALLAALEPHLAPDGPTRPTPPQAVAPATDDVSSGRTGHPTAREHQVLRLIARGHGNRIIGKQLGLAEQTIKSHSRHLFKKLGAHDRAHAVAIGYQNGLLP